MGHVERIDPAEDAERVPLPDGLTVVEGGLRFHLPDPDDGKPVCDRRNMVGGDAPTMTVKEARENHGLTACRSCFHERGEELPEKVVVSLGGSAETYHAPADDGRDCNYGPYGRDEEPVVVTVARSKAEKAGLDSCTGCFGAVGEVPDPCPLCGEPVPGSLGDHLATPENEGCPKTPQTEVSRPTNG